MADFIFNIAKGRFVRYADLPEAADAFILVLLKTAGLESDGAMLDRDTLDAIKTFSAEADFTGYARRTLASVAINQDDTNDRADVSATNPAAYTNTGASQAISKAIVCYDPDTGAGTDVNIVPVAALDCVVTFDTGVATTITFNTAGFARAA